MVTKLLLSLIINLLFLYSRRSLGSSSPRLARMLLQILNFDLDVVYQPGSQMHLSDAISRLSSHNPDKGDTIPGLDVSIHDVSICTGFNATSIQTIHEHTQKDESFHLSSRPHTSGLSYWYQRNA